MKNTTFLLLFIVTCFANNCYAQDSISKISKLNFNIKIKVVDFSEDATMNDEDFLFVYKQDGKNCFPIPLLQDYFILDTTRRNKIFNVNTTSFSSTDILTFLLLEQDTKKTIKAMEPTCRLYLNEIVALYNQKEFTKLREYFDDDDILGIWQLQASQLNLSKPMIKKFETLNFFDWSKYRIELYK
ncbi:MAG TPA: hypothetical protein PK431_05205 [Chitinophagales bacterium]|nr:hypothetical protein [Chitinophagales bacterium]